MQVSISVYFKLSYRSDLGKNINTDEAAALGMLCMLIVFYYCLYIFIEMIIIHLFLIAIFVWLSS